LGTIAAVRFFEVLVGIDLMSGGVGQYHLRKQMDLKSSWKVKVAC
jgi:hypothetical protein